MGDLDDLLRDDALVELQEIAETRMPFGRYGPRHFPPRGLPIYNLPAEYLQYFATRGWPSGRLGELLSIVYQMKADGGDAIFEALRQRAGGRISLPKPKCKSFGWE